MDFSLKSAINKFSKQFAQELLANGQITDKRDIEDPTGKFCGPRHVRTMYKTNSSRINVDYKQSEYDLPVIANAVQLDGILRRAVNIFVEHVLKNGYELNSTDDKIQQHLNRRIKEIEHLTGVAFSDTLSQIVTQLVTYGNAYLIKVRKKNISGIAKSYRLYGRELNPIVGLFVVDASTVEVGLNKKGYVITYKQEIHGASKVWDERDVIHFSYNKIPGTLTGQSQILPVLDDVRALRKLEEEIEILGFQYSIPLYLYKVGNKDTPAAPGEVDEVSGTVSNMPAYGMLVVPGHHTIEIPSGGTDTIDIIKYVQHFKQRVYSGLGVSPIAMGEADSSNRATSEVLDATMQTITKAYQQILTNGMELGLLREFLLDGGFNSITDEKEFNFPEIDIENQIKKENHLLSLFQNNIITRTEFRNSTDREITLDENDTFLNLIDIPKINAQAAAQATLVKAKESAAPSSSTKNAKSTSQKVAPANQYGKKTRPKYVKNSTENLFDGLSIFNSEDFTKTIQKDIYDQVCTKLDYTINNICEYYHIQKPSIDDELIDNYISGLNLIINNKISRAINYLNDDVKLKIISEDTKSFIFDQSDKIESLGKILVCKSLGFKTILITSDECNKHSDMDLDITNISFSKIPPFGYKCKCKVNEENLNEFK